jgi:hypothetical protein
MQPQQQCFEKKKFLHISNVEILANFASKLAKLVEIILEKRHFSKIPQIFLSI